MSSHTHSRRKFLAAGTGALAGVAMWSPLRLGAAPDLRVVDFELLPIRATERTVWLIVRLQTDVGLTGLGEASDAFGFANTTKADASRMESELRGFFELIRGRSPLEIEAFRQRSASRLTSESLVSATAYSALEQALWDLAGKALEVPTYVLFGGATRTQLPAYANINRATNPRAPAGFAAAAEAAAVDGFRAMKAAPWDGFPESGAPADIVEAAVKDGIAAVAAMREAVGPRIELMVDCHSFFDVDLAERIARSLEPYDLAWYEEPVPPERVEDTLEIKRRIQQPMAGGELLFGIAGFTPLTSTQAVDVIMPDVKHCGGLLELTRIAAMADADGVQVAPHNPSGPVSTAASVQVCAGLRNFRLLEFQWGEVEWRPELLDPPETFTKGAITVPQRPGFGIELNQSTVNKYSM